MRNSAIHVDQLLDMPDICVLQTCRPKSVADKLLLDPHVERPSYRYEYDRWGVRRLRPRGL